MGVVYSNSKEIVPFAFFMLILGTTPSLSLQILSHQQILVDIFCIKAITTRVALDYLFFGMKNFIQKGMSKLRRPFSKATTFSEFYFNI